MTLLIFYISVDGGQRAVIFDRFRGVQDEVVGEGTHFLIPWVQRPIIFDIRSKPRNVPVITGSKGNTLYIIIYTDYHYLLHLAFSLFLKTSLLVFRKQVRKFKEVLISS